MKKEFKEDFQLVQNVLKGDKNSWDALFLNILKPYIEGMCAKAFLPKHRESFKDSVMEAIYLIYSNLKKYRGDAKITSWCYYYVLEAIRKEREKLIFREKSVEIEDIIENREFSSSDEENIIKKFMYKKIEKSLLKLNKNYRRAILLHFVEGYSIPQISKMEKVSENTVKSWLKRGKKKLKKIIEEEGDVW